MTRTCFGLSVVEISAFAEPTEPRESLGPLVDLLWEIERRWMRVCSMIGGVLKVEYFSIHCNTLNYLLLLTSSSSKTYK